jgi:hypothetical protein
MVSAAEKKKNKKKIKDKYQVFHYNFLRIRNNDG